MSFLTYTPDILLPFLRMLLESRELFPFERGKIPTCMASAVFCFRLYRHGTCPSERPRKREVLPRRLRQPGEGSREEVEGER